MKPLYWIGSSRRDLKAFPEDVQDEMGRALLDAQFGGRSPKAQTLKHFGGGTVLEIVDDFDGSTYRGVYTVRFANVVYVLHAFQKKSTRGISTPKREMDLVRARLRQAEQHCRTLQAQEQSERG